MMVFATYTLLIQFFGQVKLISGVSSKYYALDLFSKNEERLPRRNCIEKWTHV